MADNPDTCTPHNTYHCLDCSYIWHTFEHLTETETA